MKKAARISINSRQGFLLSFVSGMVVRLIPEVLSYPYPIGFDTIRDIAIMKNGVIWQNWVSVFSTWLLYAILIPVYRVIDINLFLSLKIIVPILYGFNACGIYYFSRKALSWNEKKAMFASFSFVFQLSALRMSWDLHRNVLGMGILLFALPALFDLRTARKCMLFSLLAIFVVFSHELVSILMLVIVFGYAARSFLKNERTKALRSMIVITPVLLIFVVSAYFLMISSRFPFFPNVIDAQPSQDVGVSFFLENYLAREAWQAPYLAYVDLASNIVFLFGLLYLLFLPLIFIGFFRNVVLDYWTLFLLFGSLNALVTPFGAMALWHRWMFMLVYPFTFYIVDGLWRVWVLRNDASIQPRSRLVSWARISKRTSLVIAILMLVLASFFMINRYEGYQRSAVSNTSVYFPPFPSSMLRNTVPLQDVDSIAEAFSWLNRNMENSSSILLHDAFVPWGQLYLKGERVIIRFVTDVDAALSESMENRFYPAYLLWWSDGTSWYSLNIPDGFKSAYVSGRISVLKFANQ